MEAVKEIEKVSKNTELWKNLFHILKIRDLLLNKIMSYVRHRWNKQVDTIAQMEE